MLIKSTQFVRNLRLKMKIKDLRFFKTQVYLLITQLKNSFNERIEKNLIK